MSRKHVPPKDIEIFFHFCPRCWDDGLWGGNLAPPSLDRVQRTLLCPVCRQPFHVSSIFIGGVSAGRFVELLGRADLFLPAVPVFEAPTPELLEGDPRQARQPDTLCGE